MAFIVQDDLGSVAGANAYISVAEFKAYHDARGAALYGTASDTVISYWIIQATDYMDVRFGYSGAKLESDQGTEFPRSECYDAAGVLVEGIPQVIKDVCAEYAIRVKGAPLMPDPDRDSTGQRVQSKSSSVGPISESITYTSGGTYVMPSYPFADAKLRKAGFVTSGLGSRSGQWTRN